MVASYLNRLSAPPPPGAREAMSLINDGISIMALVLSPDVGAGVSPSVVTPIPGLTGIPNERLFPKISFVAAEFVAVDRVGFLSLNIPPSISIIIRLPISRP
jgi:hypothetical protein